MVIRPVALTAEEAAKVPAGQLILGMPFYTRVWSETPTTEAEDSDTIDYELGCYSAGMKDVQNLISVNGAIPVWNEETGQYYAEYVNSGATYRIWIEDTASLEEKLKVMQSSQLAGGAFWKLGLEDSSVWDTIIKYIN